MHHQQQHDEDNEQPKLKTFLLTADPTSMTSATSSNVVPPDATLWTTLPPLPDISAIPKSEVIVPTDSTSIVYGQAQTATNSAQLTPSSNYYAPSGGSSAPYSSNTNNYTMYANATPASYYQQLSTNIRQTAAAAASFPYSLTANTPYYATPYQMDYTTAAYNQPYYTNIRGSYYNPLNPSAATSFATVASSLNVDGTTATTETTGTASFTKEKKPKAKKKKTGSCSPGDETYARVFIWDLDDLTMVSRSFIANVTPQFPHYAPAGIDMLQLIERVVSVNFNDPSELQEGDVVNIEDAVVDETAIDGPIDNLRGLDVMRRVAPKYNSLRQFYQEISAKSDTDKSILCYELLERCGMAAREAELCQSAAQLQTLFNQRWQCAMRCLDLVTKRSTESSEKYANVVISTEGVVYGAAQLLVSGQSGAVPIDNIYSVTKATKESIFEKIQTRYGKKCSFVSITSSPDTTTIAKKLSIPVWPVNASDDLDKLYTAQRNFLLG